MKDIVIPILFAIVIFYLLLVRPTIQKAKRSEDHADE